MLLRFFSAREGDDYRLVLKGRCVLFGVFIVLGLITLGVSIFLTVTGALPETQDFPIGFYLGVGSGITLACAVGLVGTLRLMKNGQKMRAEFIKETDEREKEVTLKAMSATALILVAAVYVALMISVALNRTVYYTLLAVVLLFFVSFLSCRAWYNKKI